MTRDRGAKRAVRAQLMLSARALCRGSPPRAQLHREDATDDAAQIARVAGDDRPRDDLVRPDFGADTDSADSIRSRARKDRPQQDSYGFGVGRA